MCPQSDKLLTFTVSKYGGMYLVVQSASSRGVCCGKERWTRHAHNALIKSRARMLRFSCAMRLRRHRFHCHTRSALAFFALVKRSTAFLVLLSTCLLWDSFVVILFLVKLSPCVRVTFLRSNSKHLIESIIAVNSRSSFLQQDAHGSRWRLSISLVRINRFTSRRHWH